MKKIAIFPLIAVILFGCTQNAVEKIKAVELKKTYTNDKYGVGFKYPADWIVQDDAEINVGPSPLAWVGCLTINWRNNPAYYTDPSRDLKYYIAARDLKKLDFTIDGEDVYSDNLDGQLFVSHQKKVYLIEQQAYDGSGNGKGKECRPTTKEVIKSLRFN